MNDPQQITPPLAGIGWAELLISGILRCGVIVSLATILVGLVVMFVHHPSYLDSPAELQHLTQPGAAFPHTVSAVIAGLLDGRGRAIVVLGLLLLIATPILRVAVSIVVFILQRDRVFMLVTSFVLVVLLISFWLGKAE